MFSSDDIVGEEVFTYNNNHLTRSEYNYSLGLRAMYSLNEKLAVSSGLLFSNKDVSGIFSCPNCFAICVVKRIGKVG